METNNDGVWRAVGPQHHVIEFLAVYFENSITSPEPEALRPSWCRLAKPDDELLVMGYLGKLEHHLNLMPVPFDRPATRGLEEIRKFGGHPQYPGRRKGSTAA